MRSADALLDPFFFFCYIFERVEDFKVELVIDYISLCVLFLDIHQKRCFDKHFPCGAVIGSIYFICNEYMGKHGRTSFPKKNRGRSVGTGSDVYKTLLFSRSLLSRFASHLSSHVLGESEDPESVIVAVVFYGCFDSYA